MRVAGGILGSRREAAGADLEVDDIVVGDIMVAGDDSGLNFAEGLPTTGLRALLELLVRATGRDLGAADLVAFLVALVVALVVAFGRLADLMDLRVGIGRLVGGDAVGKPTASRALIPERGVFSQGYAVRRPSLRESAPVKTTSPAEAGDVGWLQFVQPPVPAPVPAPGPAPVPVPAPVPAPVDAPRAGPFGETSAILARSAASRSFSARACNTSNAARAEDRCPW